MCKIKFKIYPVFMMCFSFFLLSSCGVSTKEVIKVESLENEIPTVKAENIPIIEIEPLPENYQNKDCKPGESYYNLLKPVQTEESEEEITVIKTNVSGVDVTLNDRYIGVSDIGISNVQPRIYILGLSKEGYKDQNLFFSIADNKKQIFFIEMELE